MIALPGEEGVGNIFTRVAVGRGTGVAGMAVFAIPSPEEQPAIKRPMAMKMNSLFIGKLLSILILIRTQAFQVSVLTAPVHKAIGIDY